MARDPRPSLPRLTLRESDLLARLLRQGQELLLRHPQGAAALVRALVAEGRRFAGTDEGRAWQEQLAGSDLIKKGHLIWQAYGLDALDGAEEPMLPSQWLHTLLAAVDEADVEQVLARLMVQETDNGSTIDFT